MPSGEPPAALSAAPAQQVIPPGTLLWGIHSRQTSADEFEFIASGENQPGGRFDAPDDSYRSMYVSFHQTTAVAERLLCLRYRYTDQHVVELVDELFAAVPLLADAQKCYHQYSVARQ